MPRERGGPLCGRFAKGERAANQADLRVSQRRAAFCYKICGSDVAHVRPMAVFSALRHLCRSLAAITNDRYGPNFADLS